MILRRDLLSRTWAGGVDVDMAKTMKEMDEKGIRGKKTADASNERDGD